MKTKELQLESLSPSEIRSLRRRGIQFLYQYERNQQLGFRADVFEIFCQQTDVSHPQALAEWVQSIVEELDSIDLWISKKSKNWSLQRMARIDLAILRGCLGELALRKNINPSILIADAAEIAKEFGSENSSRFVHGILDAVNREILQSREAETAGEERSSD